MGCGTSVESSAAAAAAAAGVAPQKPSSHSRVEEQHPRSRRASGIQGTEGTAAGSACSQLVKSARPTPTKEELPGAARQMLHHQGSVRDVSDPALEDEKAAAAAVAAAAAPPPWSEVEALREACMAGALDEVRQLLLSKGSPEATRRLVLAKDWRNRTALHAAAGAGRVACCAMLLNFSGGDSSVARAEDSWRQTPLHVACEAGHRDVASLLLERGASIDAVDVYGETPLIKAANAGHATCVELLLQRGADTAQQDAVGGDALHYATQQKHQTCVDALEGHSTEP